MSRTVTLLESQSRSEGSTNVGSITVGNEEWMEGHDARQIALMEERLIIVDSEDKPIGEGSKKECHLMENIRAPRNLLHRAFSCFLFRPSDGKLLLQKRAAEKITFPNMWTNTCCSHPLHVKDEMEVGVDQIGRPGGPNFDVQDPRWRPGVRRAAQRKLDHELGIHRHQVPLDGFVYLTRIHYLAPSDGLWGEHEIDYVVFTTADVDLHINLNEVSDTKWVSKEELEALFRDPSLTFTPWFKLIAQSFLYKWWDALLSRTAAMTMLEGTNPKATSHPHGIHEELIAQGANSADRAPVKTDVHVLRDLVTDADRGHIHRML